MKKYDMSKTADFIHEFKRMCQNSSCSECGLEYMKLQGFVCYRGIDEAWKAVEKWTEENPEKPTLTRQERQFIEAIDEHTEAHITKYENGAWIKFPPGGVRLNLPFESISVGESFTIKTLLTWEVSDE